MKSGKTRFQIKFPEDVFLNALTTDTLKSTAAIIKNVGCSRGTAKNALDKLLDAGKVRKVEIEGNGYGWQKVGDGNLMELSEFTNKCQLAEEALREVLKEVDKDNEDVYWTLNDAVNMLSNLAISEGPFIGRSMMKCLLIEKEDEANSVEGDKESLNYTLRKVRLLFDTMGELGITRMNKNVFDGVLFVFYEEEEINKELAESDEAQIDDFKEQIEEIMKARPDYFEMGKLESFIECDESCRGTEKVISKEQWGEGVSCTTTNQTG